MIDILDRLGLSPISSGAWAGSELPATNDLVPSINPTNGQVLGQVSMATEEQYEEVVRKAEELQRGWRMLPAPKRGEIIREIADAFRAKKEDLGMLVSLEAGKIRAEGQGEVQETIDIADFSVGLSRQLYGLTMHSERAQHRMYEQWHPLGTIGVITAFNFPNAVWAWNAIIAAICGDAVVWKPSLKAMLVAVATHKIADDVLKKHGWSGLFGLVIGRDNTVGERMIRDPRLPLISATGSTRMGRHVGAVVAQRLGRSLLELGGNNAMIVEKDANLELAVRAILFAAVGTAGQRCTTLRRLIVHKDIVPQLIPSLQKCYAQVRVGDPLAAGTLMGPLIDAGAVASFEHAVATAVAEGGTVLAGGHKKGGNFVEPTLILANPSMNIVKEETFAPILYVLPYATLDEAIAIQNGVPQGLSSAIFTDSFRAAETFLSHNGSDCGIANVNIGTSGAEIGGAFGGEKETGGGRESGSDSWKAYMRRQTCTLNWGSSLPLAQGITFDI
jgi:aldehyde dehydrogenase (NAD+)